MQRRQADDEPCPSPSLGTRGTRRRYLPEGQAGARRPRLRFFAPIPQSGTTALLSRGSEWQQRGAAIAVRPFDFAQGKLRSLRRFDLASLDSAPLGVARGKRDKQGKQAPRNPDASGARDLRPAENAGSPRCCDCAATGRRRTLRLRSGFVAATGWRMRFLLFRRRENRAEFRVQEINVRRIRKNRRNRRLSGGWMLEA